MRRFWIVAGITIAITIAVSACIPLEPAPLDLSSGQPEPPGAVTGQAGPPGTVTCDGPFGKDASHESIVKKFGASNIRWEETSLGFEDFTGKATILYPNIPARRLEIFWFDDDKRSRTAEIHITDKSRWMAGPQLRLGMTLKQVEAINKKPFTLMVGEDDYQGLVTDWRGGTLEWERSRCSLDARIAVWGEVGGLEEATLLSSNRTLRSVKGKLDLIMIKYPKAE